jgi:hypothetical protein
MSAKESIIRKKSLEMKKRKEKKRWGAHDSLLISTVN